MDMANNGEGLRAALAGQPVDPTRLRTRPDGAAPAGPYGR